MAQQAPVAPSYKVKRVKDGEGKLFHTVMQSINGPCPLLAIANVLLLRGNILLPQNAPDVSEVHARLQICSSFN